MRRNNLINRLLISFRTQRNSSTGIDDILAELSAVSTGVKSDIGRTLNPSKLRKVNRTSKKAESPIALQKGNEVLSDALRNMKQLEREIQVMESTRSKLISEIATDGSAVREGVVFPSAFIPLSSQEMRLENGEQEFRENPEEIGTKIPNQGTVAHTTLIGLVSSSPSVLEDANGQFAAFTVQYRIPFESPQVVSAAVRGYGPVFVQYCLTNVREKSTVHCHGWLMPSHDSDESRFVVVCLPQGGNITVVKNE